MIQQVAKILKNAIDVDYIDKKAGLVRTVEKSNLIENGTNIEYKGIRFPVSSDIDLLNCRNGCFDDLVPNSSKKGILYFESSETLILEPQGTVNKFKSKLRLVVWLNWKKIINIENCESQTPQVINDILSKLDKKHTNGTTHISKVSAEKIIWNDYEIFSKYDYMKNALPYLFYPYEAIAIDLSVSYHIGKNCLPEIIINPTIC